MFGSENAGHRMQRIGRRPDPWQYPDWSKANPDGTFGNRFDDPEGRFRVLYACSARLGCFLETLARFRPDLALYAELQEIAGEDDMFSQESFHDLALG